MKIAKTKKDIKKTHTPIFATVEIGEVFQLIAEEFMDNTYIKLSPRAVFCINSNEYTSCSMHEIQDWDQVVVFKKAFIDLGV